MKFKNEESGFTLMEMMVSLALNGIILSMVAIAAISNRDHYLEDSVRTRVTSNLRSGMDIMVTNIRQAGEELNSSFPAIVIEPETSTSSDIISIRRAIISSDMLLCANASSGSNRLYLSDVAKTSSDKTACIPSSVTDKFNVWNDYRVSQGGTIKIFIWDTVNKIGEFVDFTNSGISTGDFYLDISNLDNSYSYDKAVIYVIEEFRFRRETALDTLLLNIDGDYDTDQTVAFNISNLEISLTMEDGSTRTSLLPSDPSYDWKAIRSIDLVLTGEETRAMRTFSFSKTTKVFPRNIMSY